MRRTLSLLLTGILVLFIATPAMAADSPRTRWHRLNPDTANPAPEHEVLTCLRAPVWRCGYAKIPEPELDFHWDGTTGVFAGVPLDAAACDDRLGDVCEHVTRLVGGRAAFFPDDGDPFLVDQQLIFTDGTGGLAPLYVYWVDQFACPWYRSFDDALEANPTAALDCTVVSG